MDTRATLTALLGILAISITAGCGRVGDSPETTVSTATSDEPAVQPPSQTPPSNAASSDGALETDQGTASTSSETAAESRTIQLSPQNTKLEFIGTHVGERPDPRHGTFEEFQGQIQLDPQTNAPQTASLVITTSSLKTQIDRLTRHLHSPDFLDVREFPEARFESKSIRTGDGAGQYTMTGDLTLHGVTKTISFPATISTTPAGGFTLDAELDIDRMDFGMTWGPDQVERIVEVRVKVDAGEQAGE